MGGLGRDSLHVHLACEIDRRRASVGTCFELSVVRFRTKPASDGRYGGCFACRRARLSKVAGGRLQMTDGMRAQAAQRASARRGVVVGQGMAAEDYSVHSGQWAVGRGTACCESQVRGAAGHDGGRARRMRRAGRGDTLTQQRRALGARRTLGAGPVQRIVCAAMGWGRQRKRPLKLPNGRVWQASQPRTATTDGRGRSRARPLHTAVRR